MDWASCWPWALGLGAWSLGWGLDFGFGLRLGLVDWASWDVGPWTLDLGSWDLQKNVDISMFFYIQVCRVCKAWIWSLGLSCFENVDMYGFMSFVEHGLGGQAFLEMGNDDSTFGFTSFCFALRRGLS